MTLIELVIEKGILALKRKKVKPRGGKFIESGEINGRKIPEQQF